MKRIVVNVLQIDILRAALSWNKTASFNFIHAEFLIYHFEVKELCNCKFLAASILTFVLLIWNSVQWVNEST